ncbi:MAG: serine/threonine-protein kinase [Cyanobacteria bacterium J06592_8]
MTKQIFQNRYRIQSLLARQRGRRTYQAEDLQTQLQVVIKLLLWNPEDFTWEDLKLFEREAETLKSLDHPAIPKYLDYFEVSEKSGQGFALVQSYIQARSLQNWVESGRRFSESDLKVIATQLLKVLEYLHHHQPPVIHRDIKPSNILLTDRSGNSPGDVYLIDFGSVQTVAHGGTMTIVGTYGYMPPEQFGGRVSAASDLYSLGATLIYILTGSHPADLPTRRGQIQFDVSSQVSPGFQAWLKCMVQPDLDQRLKTAQQALKALKDEKISEQDGFADSNETAINPRSFSKVYYRKSMNCVVEKTSEAITVSIPYDFQNLQQIDYQDLSSLCIPLIFIISVFLLLTLTFHKIWIFLLALILLSGLGNKSVSLPNLEDKIILRIDQYTASTWRKSNPQKYLHRVNRSLIKSIEVVKDCHYITGEYKHYVQLALNTNYLDDSSVGYQKPLLVGYHQGGLSRQEAYWLANQLKDWLELPITEVEIL